MYKTTSVLNQKHYIACVYCTLTVYIYTKFTAYTLIHACVHSAILLRQMRVPRTATDQHDAIHAHAPHTANDLVRIDNTHCAPIRVRNILGAPGALLRKSSSNIIMCVCLEPRHQ